MKIGAIYVNGWASARNPYAAGLYIGRNELLYPDSTRGNVEGNKALVRASERWRFTHLRTACREAVKAKHALASGYAEEILWPVEFDAEVRGTVFRGEYAPPSFEDWIKSGATPG
jgi:hypothetical protein